jgi:hypothetical protein
MFSKPREDDIVLLKELLNNHSAPQTNNPSPDISANNGPAAPRKASPDSQQDHRNDSIPGNLQTWN